MIKVAVSGAGGRMGKRIICNVIETDGITLGGAIEANGSNSIGKDAGEVAALGKLGVAITDEVRSALENSDLLIDFTSPEATMHNLKAALDANKGIVIGTTGLSSGQIEEIKKAAEKIRVVFAPNMSVGINLMFKVVADVAKILGDGYDVEVIEAHHRLKKDAPSGTAVKIAEVLAEALGRDLEKNAVYERKGIIGERTPDEIGIQTIRAGDIVGDHTVIFGGIGERLEITHRATNRDNFARGAVKAALWLASKETGLYDMQDVLGI